MGPERRLQVTLSGQQSEPQAKGVFCACFTTDRSYVHQAIFREKARVFSSSFSHQALLTPASKFIRSTPHLNNLILHFYL